MGELISIVKELAVSVGDAGNVVAVGVVDGAAEKTRAVIVESQIVGKQNPPADRID